MHLAWYAPHNMEAGIVGLVNGLAAYADEYQKAHESRIGDDGVLGPHWLAIAKSVRGLLDGELGRLDAGTVESMLHGMAELVGFTPDELHVPLRAGPDELVESWINGNRGTVAAEVDKMTGEEVIAFCLVFLKHFPDDREGFNELEIVRRLVAQR